MYQDPPCLNSVADFHLNFNHPVRNSPVIPSKERTELRVNLIQEELNELQEAIDNKDLVEIADALCDLQYVLSGAILEFGIADKFKDLFMEVQRSNMSKICKTENEAEDTLAYYANKGIDCFYELKGYYYVVYRSSDKKIMKSINYSPANLKSILERGSHGK